MISCRLSTILGAKRLKVSDVCRATGVARATIDRYYYDKVNSFDREVLSKLCDFLQVKPGDLLVAVEQGKLFDTDNEVALGSSAYPVTVETIFTGNEVLREPAQKP
jgi:putative transcriptional regulator